MYIVVITIPKKFYHFLRFLLAARSEMTSQHFPRTVKEGGFDKRSAGTPAALEDGFFKRMVSYDY